MNEVMTDLLVTRWEQVSGKIAALAEDKLELVPVPAGRSYGTVLRHVAFWNQYVADKLSGNKADDAANELPLDRYSTKRAVLEALNKTAKDATQALKGRNASEDSQAVELAVTFLEHTSEHYGQLAVYARLFGITPTASRS
jgi:hypothetical protein